MKEHTINCPCGRKYDMNEYLNNWKLEIINSTGVLDKILEIAKVRKQLKQKKERTSICRCGGKKYGGSKSCMKCYRKNNRKQLSRGRK